MDLVGNVTKPPSEVDVDKAVQANHESGLIKEHQVPRIQEREKERNNNDYLFVSRQAGQMLLQVQTQYVLLRLLVLIAAKPLHTSAPQFAQLPP